MNKHKFILLSIIIITFLFTNVNTYAETIDTIQMSKDRYEIEETKEEREYKEITCCLSFYTTLNSENGYGAIDAQGNKLKFGTIAIPRSIPLGTQFQFDYFGDVVFTGTDRGSTKHIRITDEGVYRIDVCIERPYGYSDSQYWQYVNNMGKVTTKGKMFIE